MRILLTGANGQVGWELQRSLAPLGELVAYDRAGLDLAAPDALRARVRELRPEVIVNAAAYSMVDRAETESPLALAINGTAPGILAEEAARLGALLVHYSSDYVFDGSKRTPYEEVDPPRPLNVYGQSKLEGERAIAATGCRHIILRTSWVYASRGRNFLLTMLRLAREEPELRVVDDQRGAPTWAHDIAMATAQILAAQVRGSPSGLFHLTAAGSTTWYGFAREILRLAGVTTPITPIATSERPPAAKRPANSALSNAKFRATFGFGLLDWDTSLRACFQSSPSLVSTPPR